MGSVKNALAGHVKLAVLSVASALQVPANAIAHKVIPVLSALAKQAFRLGQDSVAEKRRYQRVRLRGPVRVDRLPDDWEDLPAPVMGRKIDTNR